MGRTTKCKYCDEELLKEDTEVIIEVSLKGNEKKVKIHKKCITDYKELMEYKNNEINGFDMVYKYIKEILGYTNQQQLPSYLITRLQDLRNGTIMQRGIGRVIKSKDGYTYDLIIETFIDNKDSINWAFKNKTFENERNKINYMMAIVESHINDNYMQVSAQRQLEHTKAKNNLIEEDRNVNSFTQQTEVLQSIVAKTNKICKGISKFLDEEDL